MTIQVTITHDNKGYDKNVRILPFDDDGEGGGQYKGDAYNKVIKGGESVQFAIYGNTRLVIEETTDPADSDSK
jgi:hypothetical protein